MATKRTKTRIITLPKPNKLRIDKKATLSLKVFLSIESVKIEQRSRLQTQRVKVENSILHLILIIFQILVKIDDDENDEELELVKSVPLMLTILSMKVMVVKTKI